MERITKEGDIRIGLFCVERSSSGGVEDFLLLLLKFLLRQNAGFSQLSKQPELSKLIALCVGPWMMVLVLVLRHLASN